MSVKVVRFKVFPSLEDVVPNVIVIIRVPSEVYDDLISVPGIMDEFKHAVFSTVEQELNIASGYTSRVAVVVEESV